MNWDKFTAELFRQVIKDPLLAVIISDVVIKTPVQHCLGKEVEVCNAMKLNLFIIEFPYMNVVKTFDYYAWRFFVIYAAVQTVTHFILNRAVKRAQENRQNT